MPSPTARWPAARAVVVLDENDKVLHSELVAETGSEPDYDAVWTLYDSPAAVAR